MRFTFFTSSVVCCLLLFLSAKGAPSDTLQTQLENAQGMDRVNMLNEMFRHYVHTDPKKAMDFTSKALILAESLNYTRGIAAANNNLGVAYKNQGVFDKALDYYLKSLNLYKELENEEGIATSLNNIGTIYSLKKDHDRALVYYMDSYEIFEKTKDKERMAGCLNNIGIVFLEKGELDKALEYLTKAQAMEEALGQKSINSETINTLGNIYFSKKEYATAIKFYESALKVEEKEGDKSGQAYAYYNMGVVMKALLRLKESEQFMDQAMRLAISVSNNVLLRDVYKELSEVYYEQNRFKEAYEARLIYDDLRDMITNEESNRKLAQLEVAFEFQEMEKKFLALTKEAELTELQLFQSRIIILIAVMGAIILVAVVLIIINLRRSKNPILGLNEKI
jgi:tetratricopeptide (TPR) repeat protein